MAAQTTAGYGSDTRYQVKHLAKQQQHKTLIDALQKYGYDIQVKTLIMGHGGCFYHRSKETLVSIGIKEENTTKVLKKVHMHTIKCLHNIVIERRILENDSKSPCGVG